MDKLKPCPFCGSTDIRYSLKITGHFEVRYHASMYCNKCHCYGARTLTTVVKNNDYKGRTTIENDETVKQKAIDAWNTRTDEKQIPKKPMCRDLFELGSGIGHSCPTCGYDFPIGNYKPYKHCPECGQAIDRGDNE